MVSTGGVETTKYFHTKYFFYCSNYSFPEEGITFRACECHTGGATGSSTNLGHQALEADENPAMKNPTSPAALSLCWM